MVGLTLILSLMLVELCSAEGKCLRDQNFIYFSQYKLKDIQKQSQLKNTIASPKYKKTPTKTQKQHGYHTNNVHVQQYDIVLTQQKDNKQENTEEDDAEETQNKNSQKRPRAV